MYEVSTRRCARLTREVCWIGTTMRNLPTFDGLNPLETFLLEFEASVPRQQRLLAMDEAQKKYYRLGTIPNLDDIVVLNPSSKLKSEVHRSRFPKGPFAKL
jgi:hypothetical protein